jgi:hypothetical protein
MNEPGGAAAAPVEPTGVELTGDPQVDGLLARFAAVVAELADLDLTALVRLDGPSTGLHAVGRAVEAGRRRLGAFDTHYVSAVEAGDEPARYACTSTAVFLRDQHRLGIGEARRRVALAHACGARSGFSGEPRPARLPALAAAITAGVVSAEQAGVVLAVMNAVPGPLSAADREVVEAQLVQAATISDPARLARFGTAVLDRVDPDGALRDYHYAHAHRHLTVTAHRGRAGGTIRGELSVELLEKFQTIFDALAKPTPAIPDAQDAGQEPGQDPGQAIPDQREPGARRHDAVRDAFDIALNGDQLPASGGTPATVVIHLSAEQYQHQTGLAVTDHGNRIPVPDALRMADNAAIYALVNDARNVPLTLGRAARLASPGQTIALAARDRGCTFPGCDRPPAWCQRHTSWTGSTAATPTWPTSPCSAGSTTASSPAAVGRSSSATATPGGSPPPGSTPTKHPSATPISTHSTTAREPARRLVSRSGRNTRPWG